MERTGVPAERARHTIVYLHGGPDCRLTGIPEVNPKALEDFGVRVVSFDRPGYGQSDPVRGVKLREAALDIDHVATALNFPEKVWILGYSGGGPVAWAAAKYIPHRLAAVAQWAPDGNPWWPSISAREGRNSFYLCPGAAWSRYRSFRLGVRAFPPWLVGLLVLRPLARAVIKLNLAAAEKGAEVSVGSSLYYVGPRYTDKLTERKVALTMIDIQKEALRQGDIRAYYEDLALAVGDWGFDITDLRDFEAPIHLWQGTDDRDVPPNLNQYVAKVLPRVHLHLLEGDGRYSAFVAMRRFIATFSEPYLVTLKVPGHDD